MRLAEIEVDRLDDGPAPPPSGEGDECCICLAAAKTHACLPCGHRCVCVDCAEAVVAPDRACPLCRTAVEAIADWSVQRLDKQPSFGFGARPPL